MKRLRLTRRERIKLAGATLTGLVSGTARAVVSWVITQSS